MYAYVDESGDSGMDSKPGSSAYFVIAAVLFEQEKAARECRSRIRELHARLAWSERQEFKFNKADTETKKRFFATISGSEFVYLAVAFEKSRLRGQIPRGQDAFYRYAARLMFANARPHLRSATVVMDKCGGVEFRQQMRTHLMQHTTDTEGVPLITSVRTEKSHACELVQLADMVVGAIARSLRTDLPRSSEYRRMISHLELDVQVLP